ncbi:type II toxin-antitoxin system HipA family toxin [bacterium]|nr:type II toxin-antitoxin system HipA family toxin [bacterium]
MKRCYGCYEPLSNDEHPYHFACLVKLFGSPVQPILPFSEADLEDLATQIIRSRTSLPGVQAKLALHLSQLEEQDAPLRFTWVGLSGDYILKTPSSAYPQLPEVEDLSMHLARRAGIDTAAHGLVPLQSGELAYITRRMDRAGGRKWAMEDFCQLTEKLTEEKYKGSYEQIVQTLYRHSAQTGLDVVLFYEVLLFSFLLGNADMHLKNFSLIEKKEIGMVLAPAYDLLNTALVNPQDSEELALTLNGKKNRIKRGDFLKAFERAGISVAQQKKIFQKFIDVMPLWNEMIDRSFLSEEFKIGYQEIIAERAKRVL